MVSPYEAVPSRGRSIFQTPQSLLEIPALLVVLFVTAIRAISTSDLVLYDETTYLRQGLAIRDGLLPNFSSGATYADLYYALSLLSNEPVGLYFAGRATSATLLVLSIWICARMLAGAPLGWVTAAAIAATPIPYVWPGVSAPATGLLLIALALAVRFPGTASIGAGAGMAWIAAGARPELVWVAVSWSIAAVVLLLRQALRREGPLGISIISTTLGALIIPIVLAVMHGNPFRSEGREWVAFSQHYSLRNASSGLDPWVQSSIIVTEDFGSASSVSEAVATNPSAFIGHMFGNLLDTPRVVVVNLWGFGRRDLASLVGALLVFLLLVTTLVILFRYRHVAVGAIRRHWTQVRNGPRLAALILICVLLAVTVAATTVIYPRDHYLIWIASIVVIASSWVMSSLTRSARLISALLLVSVALFSLFSLGVARGVITRMAYPAPLAASVIYMIESPREWRMLGGGQGLTTYVPRLTEALDADPLPNESFGELLDRLGINAILTGSTETSPWAGVPGFADFLADPEKFGFRSQYPGSQLVLRE